MQEEGTPQAGQTDQSSQPQAGWVFTPGGAPQPAVAQATTPPPSQVPDTSTQNIPPAAPKQNAPPQDGLVTWSASEYVGNPKTMGWFATLAAATVFVAVIVYLLTTDLISSIVITILGIVVGVFAARQPQVLEYALDQTGVHIGQRFYPYNYFKTFSVVQEGAFNHISLLPLKRFAPPMALHYSPTDEDKITNTLADYLPYEEHKSDAIENFSRRVRF